MSNSRIQIFPEFGDVLNEFGSQQLKEPWGILVSKCNVYVTDVKQHAVFLYRLPELTMVKRVGKEGSAIGEFNFPRQLDVSPSEQIYVADQYNDRLVYLSTNLTVQGTLVDKTLSEPVDVKFTASEMFVLSYADNLYVHIFSLSGTKSEALITRADVTYHRSGNATSSVWIKPEIFLLATHLITESKYSPLGGNSCILLESLACSYILTVLLYSKTQS